MYAAKASRISCRIRLNDWSPESPRTALIKNAGFDWPKGCSQNFLFTAVSGKDGSGYSSRLMYPFFWAEEPSVWGIPQPKYLVYDVVMIGCRCRPDFRLHEAISSPTIQPHWIRAQDSRHISISILTPTKSERKSPRDGIQRGRIHLL